MTTTRLPAKPFIAPSSSSRCAAVAAASDALLAPRERQVLEYLVEGYSYKEIAVQLGLSIGTVSTYVNRIYTKLHVSSRREVVAWTKGGEPRPESR